jgi:hypothetical protein
MGLLGRPAVVLIQDRDLTRRLVGDDLAMRLSSTSGRPPLLRSSTMWLIRWGGTE